MIDVMTLRQFYERRKITEMKWVHEANNLVDVMTKNKSSSALRTMIDINRINLNIRDSQSDDKEKCSDRWVRWKFWERMIRKRWFSTFQRDSSVGTLNVASAITWPTVVGTLI
jgi:hypothetical protein